MRTSKKVSTVSQQGAYIEIAGRVRLSIVLADLEIEPDSQGAVP